MLFCRFLFIRYELASKPVNLSISHVDRAVPIAIEVVFLVCPLPIHHLATSPSANLRHTVSALLCLSLG